MLFASYNFYSNILPLESKTLKKDDDAQEAWRSKLGFSCSFIQWRQRQLGGKRRSSCPMTLLSCLVCAEIV
ncbi:hypothetical protein CICLE_v10010109mg [Citrus x clementina]|uniref:Uncharacterized protein n=1 Tax=Citrus clementina TaxID=85681 RepID=V4UUM5_CITCL|nr:hypothetical protein CICLE_v10010109mg [Citrus x clementina]